MFEKISSTFSQKNIDARRKAIALQYEGIQNISIDNGLLERSDDIFVIPGEYGWNDVGSWDVLGSIFDTVESFLIFRK